MASFRKFQTRNTLQLCH